MKLIRSAHNRFNENDFEAMNVFGRLLDEMTARMDEVNAWLVASLKRSGLPARFKWPTGLSG
jgi:hypothetical protein